MGDDEISITSGFTQYKTMSVLTMTVDGSMIMGCKATYDYTGTVLLKGTITLLENPASITVSEGSSNNCNITSSFIPYQ